MNKIFDILRNRWVKFGVSFLTPGFPVFLVFVDWLAFAYYLEPTNPVPLFLLYVLVNFVFGGIMFYTRKQVITRIVACITPLAAFLLLFLAFGQWYLIVPPVAICLFTFLAAGTNETFKTILGTIYLLMFVVGTLVYLTMLHFNLTISSLLSISDCDLTKRSSEYDYSKNGSYRLVQYVDDDSNERRTASFYVERTKDDIELPYLNCRRHFGSQKVLVTMDRESVSYNWISDTELYIDGRVKDLDEIFAQAEIVKEEEEEETTEKILTYYEIEGHYVAETTGSTLTPPEETAEETSGEEGAIE